MPGNENADVLYLRVRTLEKYKENYELLCSQLGELNTQVGLQLQRHEMDVTALQSIIRKLEKEKDELDSRSSEWEAKAASQDRAIQQDKEYTARIHQQLSTAADLLQTSERNAAEREREAAAKIQHLQHMLDVEANEKSVMKRALALTEEQLADATSKKPAVVSAYEQELQTMAKEHKRTRRRVDEQQQTIQDLQTQLKVAADDRDRAVREMEKERLTHGAHVVQLQQEAIHLTEVVDGSKSHVAALEAQLDHVEALKEKWQAKQDGRLDELVREVATTKAEMAALRDDKDKAVAHLERKVRDVKVRWKTDREKLKKERDDLRGVVEGLRGDGHELKGHLALLQQKNELLQREVATLQDVLAQVQSLEDEEHETIVGRARQRVLADRHMLEMALRDHIQKHQSTTPPTMSSSSSWSYR
ncbi:Aste57867_14491 [Aphanomyces stellatus]|uniref:Aste57867_14491 protein n=1 Tax=Aphanomyces stellatus TaxID=120398 RepID=A0A485L0S2_9STRA|nr:hypothetical protein As57867_014437 [Aphanomyces stellatus]VFT91313.1 Aste57867_14491 [Aphanomyces stellatus]